MSQTTSSSRPKAPPASSLLLTPAGAANWSPFRPGNKAAPTAYPSGFLLDELSGMTIPKDPAALMEWRKSIRESAESDPETMAGLMELLRKSPVLFVHLFCWTLVFFEFKADGSRVPTRFNDRPFVLWPAQDRELIALHKCVLEGRWRRCVKSREMGWSWLETCYDLWLFCMWEKSKVLVVSRKEDEVYDRSNVPGGDPDAIFTKYKYNLDRFPAWLTPGGWEMTNLLLGNAANGATISGESTNENIGRSGRSTRAWIDEAAFVPNLHQVERAIGGNCGSLSLISTPQVGSYFGELASSEAYEQRSMWWYEHPEKTIGLVEDEKAPGKVKLVSPWKWNEEKKGRKYVAVEVEGDEGAAGDMLFDFQMLSQHKAKHAKEPLLTGDLLFSNKRDDGGTLLSATGEPEELYEGDDKLRRREYRHMRWEFNPGGEWSLWCDLARDEATGIMRPRQDTVYAMGADPGDGRLGANSAIVILDAWTGDQVASFVSARYSARDLGRIMAAASLWFGGKRAMLLGWETNGIGGGVTEILSQHLRMNGLYRKKVFGRSDELETDSLGWSSTAAKKRYLLDEMQGDMAAGEVRYRDQRILDEARTFVIISGGWVTQGRRADMQTSAREAHGDITIAAAVANLMRRELPEQPVELLEREAAMNLNTWHGRHRAHVIQREAANQPRWRRS